MKNQTIARIQNQMEIDTDNLLGTQIFWSLSEVGVSYDYLENLMASNGLEKAMPRRCTPCSAWSRAIADFKKSEYGKKFHVDSQNIPAKDGQSAKGLLTVHSKTVNEGAAKVEFRQDWSYLFNKDAGRNSDPYDVIIPQHGKLEVDYILLEIVQLYKNHLNTVNYADVLKMIKCILDTSVSFTMKKGIYFIPAQNRQFVDVLEKIVGAIGGSQLFTLDLPKTSTRNVETVKLSAREAFKKEIKTLENQIEAAMDGVRIKQDGDVSNTYVRLVTMLNDYRKRTNFYKDMLAHEYNGLEDKVVEIKDRIEEALLIPKE